MTTLNEIHKLTNNPFSGAIGLEIETETESSYEIPEEMRTFWSFHNDGSLRNYGVEYVFSQPYDLFDNNYCAAMESFRKLAASTPFLHSIYSSVHVHFNMMKYEMVHIMNFIALYFLFEEVLTNYCGPDRNGNLFCLKTSNAELIYMSANALAQSYFSNGLRSGIRQLNPSTLKYGGLNLSSLKNLGSLEIRTHQGTTNVDEINRWVSILHKIYVASKEFSDPSEILNKFREKGPITFLQSIFLEDSYFLDIDYFFNTLNNPLWYTASFVNSVPTWKNFGKGDVAQSVKSEKNKTRFKKVNLTQGSTILYADDEDTSFFLGNITHFNELSSFFSNSGSIDTFTLLEDE